MTTGPTTVTEPRGSAAAEPAARPRTPRRADIQALRAIAVTLVVLFHFWPGRMPGGYIGVDVFFVISGYLITSHLLREAGATGRIALGRFWARRARRLLPAAYLVIAVAVLITFVACPHTVWQEWFEEFAGATVYVENWVLAAHSVNYLAADNAPSPVQHYWSLSAEEQFYLLWPLLVLVAAWLAARLSSDRRRAVGIVVALATVASFVYSLHATTSDPSSAYFVTPARAWQFGAGALLAVWSLQPHASRGWDVGRSVVSWAGFAAIAAGGLFLFDASTPFPGTAALVPVLATMAVIWAGEPERVGAPTWLVRRRPVGYLGDVSYSLYLWHWPPLIILPAIVGHELGLMDRLGLIVVVVAVAALSKVYVEDRVRFSTRLGIQRTGPALALTAAAAAVLVAFSLIGSSVASHETATQEAAVKGYVAHPPPCFGAASMDVQKPCTNHALDGLTIPAPEAVSKDYADYPGCWVDVDQSTLQTGCTFGDTTDPDVPHVILIGDSHARAMLPAFVELAKQGKLSVTAQLKATCAWTTGRMGYDDPARSRSCEEWKAQLRPWLIAQAKSTDLIVTTGYLKTLGGSSDQQVKDMAAAWKPLADLGVPIVGVQDNPYHDYLPYKCLERLSTVTPDSCAEPQKKAFPLPDTFARTAKVVQGASSIDLTGYYCRNDICPSVIGGVTVYRDNSHLTTTYTTTLTPYILRALQQVHALP